MSSCTDCSTPERPWIEQLLNRRCYDHDVHELKLIETHISWVILTGPYAYKIKKPVNLGFADFSTLKRRKHFCEEELRLNRRLAPDIYLAVLPICANHDGLRFGDGDEVVDYAVKMRQFPQSGLLTSLVEGGQLSPDHIDELAALVADFHKRIACAETSSPHADPEQVHDPVSDNFAQIRPLVTDSRIRRRLDRMCAASDEMFRSVQRQIAVRGKAGKVRECHGDMHLGNIALVEDKITVFDGIDFNEGLRWIDVMSEIGLLIVDLEHHGRADLAWRFLNRYLERTGDYAGMAVLPYYLAYRAMVRAKVTCLRQAQAGVTQQERGELQRTFLAYLELAERYLRKPVSPVLLIMHGVSASGKSTVGDLLAINYGALRIRSDVERKRIFADPPEYDNGTGIGLGLYSPVVTDLTYRRVYHLAEAVLRAGTSVIIDATFLNREHRNWFQELAPRLGAQFFILDVTAGVQTLRERILARQHEGKDPSDAGLAVLERQLESARSFEPGELPFVIHVDSETEAEPSALLQKLDAAISSSPQISRGAR
ncbi:MAG: AAA family ATPase [Gammaproteobacteria bacterium]